MNSFPFPRSAPSTRRRFLAAATTTTLASSVAPFSLLPAIAANSGARVSLGLIGAGGRGRWIANHFRRQGGFNLTAVADYFPERASAACRELGVAGEACFSGLDGYRRLLETKVDAVVIESPPYFHPAHAAAAVEAGKHVYLAKPVAVDVPGCLSVEDSGRRATAKKRCFLVDFQTRAHPAYQEVAKWILTGRIGQVVSVESNYQTSTMFQAMGSELAKDPGNAELRLRCWAIDRVLSGDIITEQNIHALDVVTWFLDAAPEKAVGTGGLARGFGTCWDHFSVAYRFPHGVINTFSSKQVGHGYDDILCRVYGTEGTADTHYFGEVWVKSNSDGFNGGTLKNLYQDGVVNNIASFHRAIAAGDFSNPTVAPSVRSNLTTILGRTAAYSGAEVSWDEMLRRAERWEFSLRSLKS